MTVQWEKVYIFISSTFNDMHAERDYLVKQVFPQLQEWCEKRKLRLVDIDLRWGVTEADATQNKRVVQVCLERIDACRPFFLCFLGQRRGWVPGQGDISPETYRDYPELARYAGEASVTEMEILHALINPLHQGKTFPTEVPPERYDRVKYAFFYLRQPGYLQQLPGSTPQLCQVYTNAGIGNPIDRQKADEELRCWRDVHIPQTRRPVRAYNASWDPDASTPEIHLPLSCPSTAERRSPGWWAAYTSWARQWAQAGVQVNETGEIDDPAEREKAEHHNTRLSQGRLRDFRCMEKTLADTIVEDLKSAIQERYPDHVEKAVLTPLQSELDQQERFLQTASDGFIEREGDFAALDQYLMDGSQQVFILTAPGGSGKTSLLASWIDRLPVDYSKGESLHFRFIGASDGSTTADTLLRSLLREVQETTRKFEVEIPSDPNKLRIEFPQLLEAAGKKGKTVIVLDGLNQLETRLSDLAWLPLMLPANVKLVVSFKRGEAEADSIYQRLRSVGKGIFAEVRPFESLEDRRKLVKVYLSQYLKELDERHVEALIHSEGASNPLYLKVVLSELRVFGVFANLGEKIRDDFGADPISAFQGVLKRLENDPAYSPVEPELLAPRLFGWLAHARQGLSVEELSGLLVQENQVSDDPAGKQKALEAVHGMLRQMRPYLARRDGRIDFFYESFKMAAIDRYVRRKDEKAPSPMARLTEEWHGALARYFERQTGTILSDAYRHRLYELPYQQKYACLWAELEHTLTDFDFLEEKFKAFPIYALEEDYLLALREWEGSTTGKSLLTAFEERLRLERDVLRRTPELFFPHLYNHLTWLDAPSGPLHTKCEQAGRNRKGWLRSLQDLRSSPSLWLRSLQGHTKDISTAVVTPDGKRIVTGSTDKTIKIWDLASGHLLQSLVGHNDVVNTVVVSPDGRLIISGAGNLISTNPDRTIKIWELDSGRLLRTLEGHSVDVRSLAITPDGNHIVSGSGDHSIKVWDLHSGKLLRTLEGHEDKVNSVVVSSDGVLIISGAVDHTIKVWNLVSGQLIRTLSGHTELITSVTLSSDGKLVISASHDHSIKVWDLESGRLLRTLEGHTDTVKTVTVSPDGKQIISASFDNTIRVWDVESGHMVRVLKGQRQVITAMAITPDGEQVAVCSSGTIDVLDLADGRLLTSAEGHANAVTAVAVSADEDQIISCSLDGTIRVWEIETGQQRSRLEGHADGVTAMALSREGTLVTFGIKHNTIKVWNLETGALVQSIKADSTNIYSLAVSPDGKKVISGSDNCTIKIWDVVSGQPLRTLKGHLNYILALAVSHDGKSIISGSADNVINVWDMESGRLLHTIGRHFAGVTALAVGVDGKKIVSGSGDGTIKIWDSERRQVILTLIGHSEAVRSLAITPDEYFIISGSDDCSIKVWDARNGKILSTLEGHGKSVSGVAYSLKRGWIVSGSNDVSIKIWDIESRYLPRSLDGHTDRIKSIVFTPDELEIVSCSNDNRIKYWDIKTGQLTRTLVSSTKRLTNVVLSPDGKQVISGSQDPEISNEHPIMVWDVESGQLLRSLKGHTDQVDRVVISLDGKTAISFAMDNTILAWDLASGRMMRKLKGRADLVTAIAISPGGNQVISGNNDGTINVWDIANGLVLKTLVGHKDAVNGLVVSRDGRLVISCSGDHTVIVWDLEKGSMVRRLQGHTFNVSTLAASPDGKLVFSGSFDKTIRFWDVENDVSKVVLCNDAHITCLGLSTDCQCLVCGDAKGRVWTFEWVDGGPLGLQKPSAITELITGSKITVLEREQHGFLSRFLKM